MILFCQKMPPHFVLLCSSHWHTQGMEVKGGTCLRGEGCFITDNVCSDNIKSRLTFRIIVLKLSTVIASPCGLPSGPHPSLLLLPPISMKFAISGTYKVQKMSSMRILVWRLNCKAAHHPLLRGDRTVSER